MRLDHLLSRETSEARDCGAKPEVEARKRKGARANGSGRGKDKERRRAANGTDGIRQELAQKIFTISFSGIADRTLTTAQSKSETRQRERASFMMKREGARESRET